MTDDENRPQRPNANYKLSKPDDVNTLEEQLVFHYSRERRLEKAPEAVKDLYVEKKGSGRFGAFKNLVADKPRATLFFVIIIMCAFLMIFSMMGKFDNSYSLDGQKIVFTGTRYEGTTIIILKKTLKKSSENVYSGVVDIAVSPVIREEDEEFPVFYHRVFFSLEENEEFRFAVPFDVPELLILVQTEKNTLNIILKPE